MTDQDSQYGISGIQPDIITSPCLKSVSFLYQSLFPWDEGMTTKQSVTNLVLIEALHLILHLCGLWITKFSAIFEVPNVACSIVCVLSHSQVIHHGVVVWNVNFTKIMSFHSNSFPFNLRCVLHKLLDFSVTFLCQNSNTSWTVKYIISKWSCGWWSIPFVYSCITEGCVVWGLNCTFLYIYIFPWQVCI